MSVLCIFSMYLFIYSPYCISVSHLDLGKVLIFSIESLLKIRNNFLSLLEFFYLLKKTI